MESSKSNPRVNNSPPFNTVTTRKSPTSKESKVKSMFKIYKNVLNKMHKATSTAASHPSCVSSNPRLNRGMSTDATKQNGKERLNCFTNNANGHHGGLTKSLLLHNELSCVRKECGNVSASTLSGIGYFRRASLSSSSENFDLNQNVIASASDKSAIKLYDGHKSLIKQLDMHKVTSNYDSNNNLLIHSGCGDLLDELDALDVFYSPNKAIGSVQTSTDKQLVNASKLVKDSMLTVEEDMRCDLEVASFFDTKKKRLAKLCAEHMWPQEDGFPVEKSLTLDSNEYYEQQVDDGLG